MALLQSEIAAKINRRIDRTDNLAPLKRQRRLSNFQVDERSGSE
jgi:hypothetical protein